MVLLAPIADVVAQHWDPLIILIAKLVTVGALVALNGFFVVAEFALVKIRDSQLKTLVDEGVTRAALVKQIRDNLNAYLSACQVGITAASLGLGWLGEPFLARRFSLFRYCRIEIAVIKSCRLRWRLKPSPFYFIVQGKGPQNSAIPKSLACHHSAGAPRRFLRDRFTSDGS